MYLYFLYLLNTIYNVVTQRPIVNPCNPSPCGPNSQCREINNHAVCSCVSGYIGVPPMCRPECVVSSECPLNRACVDQKCSDPCPGTCGANARCQVVNHNPICSCPSGYSGDPFIECRVTECKLFLFMIMYLFPFTQCMVYLYKYFSDTCSKG